MCLNPYPPIPVTWRQSQRYQQFVPGLGIDDGVPQLRVGPAALPPEMGCIQPEADNVAFQDPDRPSRVGAQSQRAHHVAPVRSRCDSILQLDVRPCAFGFGIPIHDKMLTAGTDISETMFELQLVGTPGFEPGAFGPPDRHANQTAPRPAAPHARRRTPAAPGRLRQLSATAPPPGNQARPAAPGREVYVLPAG